MTKKQAAMAAAVAAMVAVSACSSDADKNNPFLQDYDTPFGIPPFEQITTAHYLPALKEGIRQQQQEIEAIVNNPEAPTFENTILAFEQSGKVVDRVAHVFFALSEAMNDEEMDKVAAEFMPLFTSASDEIMMNDGLFQRVKSVYEQRDSLPLAERRAVEKLYTDFERNGALLTPEQKEELKKLNGRMADLYLAFNKNLLNATNAFEAHVTDETRLSGIPASVVAVAAEEAKNRGKEGWVFTLHAPSRLPVLQFANDRDLRKEVYEGYTTLASAEPYDNKKVIAEILKVRTAKAKLLGYDDFASYMTANVMAQNPKAAEDLLMQIWEPAKRRVATEVKEMQAVADAENADITVAPYDYYYYAEKVRKQKYDLNEEQVKEYFTSDNVTKGIFTMAEKLYGLSFEPMPDAPKYHPDVNVYEVKDSKGEHLAVFLTDYFSRPSKRQGAWMDNFVVAFEDPDCSKVRPMVYNVGNFAKPTADSPSLLSVDDVQTAFHEFGHGLHGMLTRTHLRSQSGTNVDRDFVELPSQIHEHWAFNPEIVKEYARHYKTGEVIPDSLIEKINAAGTHNMGFMTTELVGAALLDLAWGRLNVADGDSIDVAAFEADVAKRLGMPAELTFRYRSPYFKHIFGSDGYASGYYTYLWAETLDKDAYELFEQNGPLDRATADSFRENILEPGGSVDPMELFVKFRGHKPGVEPLLKSRGLKD